MRTFCNPMRAGTDNFRRGQSLARTEVNFRNMDCEVFPFALWGSNSQPRCGGKVDLAIVVPEELEQLCWNWSLLNRTRTYILIKAGIVKIDWFRPSALIPNVVGIHVESTREDPLLIILCYWGPSIYGKPC